MIVVNGFSLSNCTPDLSHERNLRIGDGAVGIYNDGTIVRVIVLNPKAAKARGECGFECRPCADRFIVKAARAIRYWYVYEVATAAAALVRAVGEKAKL